MENISIKRGRGTVEMTQEQACQSLDDLEFLELAVFTILRPDLTVENFDFPFDKQETLNHLKEMYLERSDFSKDFIEQAFEGLLIKPVK